MFRFSSPLPILQRGPERGVVTENDCEPGSQFAMWLLLADFGRGSECLLLRILPGGRGWSHFTDKKTELRRGYAVMRRCLEARRWAVRVTPRTLLKPPQALQVDVN